MGNPRTFIKIRKLNISVPEETVFLAHCSVRDASHPGYSTGQTDRPTITFVKQSNVKTTVYQLCLCGGQHSCTRTGEILYRIIRDKPYDVITFTNYCLYAYYINIANK